MLSSNGSIAELLDYHFQRAMCVDQKALLQTKEKPATHESLPPVVTFNKMLPNIKNTVDKNLHIASIIQRLKKAVDKKPFIVCRKNKNLQQTYTK